MLNQCRKALQEAEASGERPFPPGTHNLSSLRRSTFHQLTITFMSEWAVDAVGHEARQKWTAKLTIGSQMPPTWAHRCPGAQSLEWEDLLTTQV